MSQPGQELSRDDARQTLAVMAHAIRDLGEDDAAARLLERVAMSGSHELRSLLLEYGAREVIREVRT